MNNGCYPHGISIVSSAGADSQIAGVLAGFVFIGITLLLGRRRLKNIQTLCLFSATFVAQGFDSQLWSVISGSSANLNCSRLWSETMVATGLLAVGGMAIVTGISWLLYSHLDQPIRSRDASSTMQNKPVINPNWFIRIMAYGVGVTVTLLMAVTSKEFLYAAFSSHAPTASNWITIISPISVFAVPAGLTVLGRIRHGRDKRIIPYKGLEVAAYGILGYAVAGPVFGGVVVQLGVSSWQPPSGVLVGATIALGLAIPALLVISLVHAVPPLPWPPEALPDTKTATTDHE